MFILIILKIFYLIKIIILILDQEMKAKNPNLAKEIAIILIIKIILLLLIKHIWFDAPTVPKDFNNQVAEHITGNSFHNQETP